MKVVGQEFISVVEIGFNFAPKFIDQFYTEYLYDSDAYSRRRTLEPLFLLSRIIPGSTPPPCASVTLTTLRKGEVVRTGRVVTTVVQNMGWQI